MALDPIALQALNKEITNDPKNEGYSGKTIDEVAALLNNPKIVKTPVVYHTPPPPPPAPNDGDIIGETVIQEDARVAVVLQGIPFAPNQVTANDVKDALALNKP